jgi:hypothetical protein
MRRRPQPGRTTSPPLDPKVLQFVSRADQLQLRGQRNYDRYMRVIKKHVSFDGPVRAQWQKESAEDAVWDAEWNKRHGPLPGGGARILPWRHARELQAWLFTSTHTNIS